MIAIPKPYKHVRNQASELDLGWINQIRVNRAATDRRAASMVARRSVKKEYQAAWLIKAIQCIDLTTLGGDDTPGRVERLCLKALRPLRADLAQALGQQHLRVGAVCVYHEMIAPALRALMTDPLHHPLPIAAVSTGGLWYCWLTAGHPNLARRSHTKDAPNA